jgi:hypothetical protein
MSLEKFSITTQVLNLNHDQANLDVRHRVALKYVPDRELETPMKPLFTKGVYGLKLLEGKDGYFGLQPADADADKHGPGCLAGENAADHTYRDGMGREFTGHWVVKPGREENRTLVTKILNLPYDTTVHYVAVHVHPFCESIALRDLTTGETVYEAKTKQTAEGIGLADVEHYSSETGFPLYKDHEYELVSVYSNTSNEDQDSMAVLNLYMLDKDFKLPVPGVTPVD